MNIKKRFTKWYVKKGYKFSYDSSNCEMIGSDDIFPPIPKTPPVAVWHCPWWVKPLLILFSPSVYFVEAYIKLIVDRLMKV